MKLTRSHIESLPLPAQAAIFFRESADTGPKGPTLPLRIQNNWHNDWRATLDNWIANLPWR
jgi:hypothetical protein